MIDVIFAKENIIKPEIHLVKEERGVFFFRLSFEANELVSNVQFSILLPMKGLLSTFQATYDRVPHIFQWWASYSFPSTFYNGAPFLTVCDKEKVYANVALSDAINDTQIRFAVNDFDEDEKIAFVITLLSGRKACTSYEVDIRVDTRPLALEESMKSLSDWWLDYYPVQKELPRAAEEPLYSTWYNFHQHPNAQALVPELTLAKKLGFKTVILDDGWQFDGNGTGDYINCGDWAFSKEKFPNGLKEIKELDLKLAMWFCVPFVGWNTSAYKKFKNKLLYNSDHNHCGILDVRYQECRTFILDTLCDFVKKSGLDGLKLDFIDSFCLKDNSPKANNKMDEPDLALAVIRLLTDLSTRLESLCPNALIEFRQNYIGPAITRFGNMLRVGDCAFDSNLNRRRLADLRLLHYPIAIHSDMLYWAQDETNENIARQLLSVLYSVPQISVLLTKANEDQKTIIQNFLHYWTENRDILLHSNFKGIHQEMGYPILEAWNEEKHIITLYASMPIRITGTYDIWNATEENVIFVELTQEYEATLYDVLGKEFSRQKMYPGYQAIALPVGGRIELKS